MARTEDQVRRAQDNQLLTLLSNAITASTLTQTDIADRTGYSQSVISDIKKGQGIARPTFVLVANIARVLRLSLDDMASEIGIPVAGAKRARTLQRLDAVCTILETTGDHAWRDAFVARVYQEVTERATREANEDSPIV